MKLQLTIASRNRWHEVSKTVAWREKLDLSEKDKAQLIFGHSTIHKEYKNDIATIKIGKWYHVLHLLSMLCIGRVSNIHGIAKDFADLSWSFAPLSDDPERLTLIATSGKLQMIFKCNLQYEEVIDD